MSSMSDALSAAGLLVAAISLVYSAWSPSIERQISRTYSAEAQTRNKEKNETREISNFRALPLMVACWFVFLTFLPRSGIIMKTAILCATKPNLACSYDDVSAIFILTELVVAGLALHLSGRVGSLQRQIDS